MTRPIWAAFVTALLPGLSSTKGHISPLKWHGMTWHQKKWQSQWALPNQTVSSPKDNLTHKVSVRQTILLNVKIKFPWAECDVLCVIYERNDSSEASSVSMILQSLMDHIGASSNSYGYKYCKTDASDYTVLCFMSWLLHYKCYALLIHQHALVDSEIHAANRTNRNKAIYISLCQFPISTYGLWTCMRIE